MENTRLLTEQLEALEQQTATAEVLQVINANPGNLVPVFATILDKAMRLCEAAFGGLFTYDGERFHTVASLGTPPALTEFRTETRHPPARQHRCAPLGDPPHPHILDRAQEPDYLAGEPGARAIVELGGARSMLNVPLNKDDKLLGYISIYRQEVRPFSDKQVALLENFAAQAVIAMENARLLDRDARGAGTADRDRRGAGGHQRFTGQPGAGVRRDAGEGDHGLCGAAMGSLRTLRRRALPRGRDAGSSDTFAEHAAARIPGFREPGQRGPLIERWPL